MATILVGYDTETAAVGEALSLFTESPNFSLYAKALDPETCREALELLTEVHADVGVPATLFVCGRTLLHALEPVRAAPEEGYPDILELPFQFWLDVVWFDQHGYDMGPAFLEALKGAVDEVVQDDLVYGACFHDWVAMASDERRVGWIRGFLRYALDRGGEVTTSTDYWRRVTST